MIFSCSNASIEGIYFNKKITFKGLSKKVFFLATHPPQLPCSAVEPPNNTAKAEWRGIETVTVWGQIQCGLGTWVHPPTVTPSQNKMVLSPSAWLCQAWHQGLPQVAHFLHTQLVHSPVHFSSLCRKVSLSCNPRKSKPIPVRYGETTGRLKKALSCILVFLMFVKDTCSHSHCHGR